MASEHVIPSGSPSPSDVGDYTKINRSLAYLHLERFRRNRTRDWAQQTIVGLEDRWAMNIVMYIAMNMDDAIVGMIICDMMLLFKYSNNATEYLASLFKLPPPPPPIPWWQKAIFFIEIT